MITLSQTNVTPEDLKSLRKGRGSLVRNILGTTLPISIVLGALIWLISQSIPVAVIVGSLLFFPSAISNLRFFSGVQKRAEGSGEELEAIRVHASQVVEVGHFGSDGPAWVFLTSEGRAIMLVGQWLLEQKRFPSLSFTVYRWADTHEPLRIRSHGKRVRPVESAISFEVGFKISQIEIFDASLDTLQNDLRVAFAAQTAN